MDIMVENWFIGIAALAVLIVVIAGIIAFFAQPTEKQLKQIREWLLIAVTEAERELGGGTGQLKLRYVYDLFLIRFTWVARFVSFELFSSLVDEALEQMRHLLATNQAARALVVKEEAEQWPE